MFFQELFNHCSMFPFHLRYKPYYRIYIKGICSSLALNQTLYFTKAIHRTLKAFPTEILMN